MANSKDLRVVSSPQQSDVCPRCKNGNGRQFDGAGGREPCYGCRGKGTYEAYRLHREFVKGWNAAVGRIEPGALFPATMEMP